MSDLVWQGPTLAAILLGYFGWLGPKGLRRTFRKLVTLTIVFVCIAVPCVLQVVAFSQDEIGTPAAMAWALGVSGLFTLIASVRYWPMFGGGMFRDYLAHRVYHSTEYGVSEYDELTTPAKELAAGGCATLIVAVFAATLMIPALFFHR